MSKKPNRRVWETGSTNRSVAGEFYDKVWDYAEALEAENASLTEKVRLAVIELVEQDKWEEPVKRLCEIAGLEYPAITAKVEPQSVADAHEGE